MLPPIRREAEQKMVVASPERIYSRLQLKGPLTNSYRINIDKCIFVQTIKKKCIYHIYLALGHSFFLTSRSTSDFIAVLYDPIKPRSIV